MKNNNLILLNEVCTHCKVEVSFINSLNELGHIEIILEENDQFIHEAQLKSLESLIYFYTELQINIEGIDVIARLLKKIETLQNVVDNASNKIKVEY